MNKTALLKSLGRVVHSWVQKAAPWSILFAAVALLVSMVQFFVDYGDRVRDRESVAWHTLGIIAPGNSGKVAAMEALNLDDGMFCFKALRGKLDWLHKEAKDQYSHCIRLMRSKKSLHGINLSRSRHGEPGVYLYEVDLYQADLTRANLSGALMDQAELFGATLVYANLSDASLRIAKLKETKLQGSNLQNADLFRAEFDGAYLHDADMTDANLLWASLVNTALPWSKLCFANLSHADLEGADLSYANLSYADLTGADLRWTRMNDVLMIGTDLSGANLQGALNLTQKQLEKACGDRNTQLPGKYTITMCSEADLGTRRQVCKIQN